MHNVRRIAFALVTVTAIALPTSARAQGGADTTKLRLIREFIGKARLVDQAMQVIEQAVPAQRAANPRVPAVFWDRFVEQTRARKRELEDGYVAIYDRNFTTDEIRQLTAFYDSPIGKRFLEKQPALTREGMQLGQEWGTRIGADVGRSLAAEGAQPGP